MFAIESINASSSTVQEDGWPHYEAIKGLPTLTMKAQEDLLKKKIVEYFETL